MQVKHVILLTLDLNMWKLDPTRPKHVIKTNQKKKKKKIKNPKSTFLGTSMRTHTYMKYAYTCLMYVYSYIKHAYAWNLVLKQQQNNNQTKTNMYLIQN